MRPCAPTCARYPRHPWPEDPAPRCRRGGQAARDVKRIRAALRGLDPANFISLKKDIYFIEDLLDTRFKPAYDDFPLTLHSSFS